MKNQPKRNGHNLNSLPGSHDISRMVLPNEIVILTRSNFNSPSVVINGFVSAGSLFDSDEKLGLADFVSSAVMRGTEKYSFQKIYDILESCGASLTFDSGTHVTSFGGRSLAEDIDVLFDVLSEAMRHPVFPSEQVERLRAQFLTGLSIRAQDTADMSSLTFDEIVYDDHPYHRPEDGYPETIQKITLQDLREYHASHYGPAGATVAVVGAIDPQQVHDKVAQYLGDWSNPNQVDPEPLPNLKPLTETVRKTVFIPGKYQADVMIGVAGPERLSPDYMPAALGNSILGQFGMMGRIGDVVREKAGLAYYASSNLTAGLGPGSWSVSAGVAPENIEKAINLIIEEIKRFANEPVSAAELSDSQANFIGRLPLSLESNSGVAAGLINLERYRLGLDYYQDYANLVNSVTVEQVLATAQRYLDSERLAIAIAGTVNGSG